MNTYGESVFYMNFQTPIIKMTSGKELIYEVLQIILSVLNINLGVPGSSLG